MIKYTFLLLLSCYIGYSILIYCNGTYYKPKELINGTASKGFKIWQSKNCMACHQLYGLGGYMGPDLTNIISDSTKGAAFARAFIANGSAKMPNFHFSNEETDNLIAFLQWVDKSGKSKVSKNSVTPTGNYQLNN